MSVPDFQRLEWSDDRMLVDGYVFRLQQASSAEWDLDDDCFVLYKGKALNDQYERFFAGVDVDVRSILELGMWEGGSLAYWNLLLSPETHVGVDLRRFDETPYFRRFVESRRDRSIRTHWGVDQADVATMRRIVAEDFAGSLDVVIDDASHRYGPTRTSFETLFPSLRAGGLYVVEDWAWAHWPRYQSPDHPMARDPGLSRFVTELHELVGSAPQVAARMWVLQGFAVVERGPADLAPDFRIDDHVIRRPAPRSGPGHLLRREGKRARRHLGRWLRRATPGATRRA